MLRNIKLRTKILIAFFSIAILTLTVSGAISFRIGLSTLEQEAFNKLTAVREMKAGQIEDYFQQISDQAVTLSEDRMIIDAMRAFDENLHNVDTELGVTDADMEEMDAALRDYYEEEFLERLIPNLLEDVTVADFWPENKNSRILQYLYIADNPNQTGAKHLLDNAGDGSAYSQTHETFHPIIRNFLEKFGYYDIFLVDVESGGHISYSVFKEVDYGTSLLSGPYSDTNFAEAYQAARDATDKDFVKIVDFEPYPPSYNAPGAFIASPIFDGDEKVGVLVFQMPIDKINDIMTNKQAWCVVGLGQSGETYLVGDDFLLRNQSRSLIEDSENYFKLIEEIGTPLTTLARIRNLNSTIGLQEVNTVGTKAALQGETGTQIFPDYRGIPVFSAYKPLDLSGLNWVIMSEIDKAEALAVIYELGRTMLISFLVLMIVIAVIAVFFTRSITNPLQQLTNNAQEVAEGNLAVEIDTRGKDEIGVLAQSFDSMQKSIQRLVRHQEQAIDALSIPLIPLTNEIVIVPLVGELDERRVNNIRQTLIEGLHASSAKVAILDLTGTPPFDHTVADSLVRTAKTARLLGAQVIITGIQPAIARELVELDLQFDGIVTERSLQNGIEYAMKHI